MDEFKPLRVTINDYTDECKEITIIEHTGFGCNGGRKGKKSNEVTKEDRERNIKRVIKNVRRQCLANDLGQIHLVLTYKIIMQDVDKADKHFKDFIFALRQIYPSLLYVATREFQKRGSLHYHVVLNQRVDLKKINLLWNKQEVKVADHTKDGFRGWVSIVSHKSQYQAVKYVLKYISKELGDNREGNTIVSKNGHTKKAYLSSHGLKKELEQCTSKFLINSSEGYAELNDGINFMLTNIPAVWDIKDKLKIETFEGVKELEFRSLLCCVNKAV